MPRKRRFYATLCPDLNDAEIGYRPIRKEKFLGVLLSAACSVLFWMYDLDVFQVLGAFSLLFCVSLLLFLIHWSLKETNRSIISRQTVVFIITLSAEGNTG